LSNSRDELKSRLWRILKIKSHISWNVLFYKSIFLLTENSKEDKGHAISSKHVHSLCVGEPKMVHMDVVHYLIKENEDEEAEADAEDALLSVWGNDNRTKMPIVSASLTLYVENEMTTYRF
jgi:hypothetical protein